MYSNDQHGLTLNIFGTFVSTLGLLLNVLGKYSASYDLWILSDFVFIIMFWGVYRGRWRLNGGALVQVLLYMAFLIVTVAGRARLV